eukprot:scaffold38796_cov44-Prasinocladus_malaysianus.AAC.2
MAMLTELLNCVVRVPRQEDKAETSSSHVERMTGDRRECRGSRYRPATIPVVATSTPYENEYFSLPEAGALRTVLVIVWVASSLVAATRTHLHYYVLRTMFSVSKWER